MNIPRPYRPSRTLPRSLAKPDECLLSDIAHTPSTHLAGSFNDEILIRGIVTKSIRNCSKSRDAIADEISVLVGARITKRSLDSFTSESAEQNRFPLQITRAFCETVGDWELLNTICQRSGLHAVTNADYELLELGREYLRQKRAQAAMDALERKLSGVDL